MGKLKNTKCVYQGWIIKDEGEGLFNMEFVSCIESDGPGFVKNMLRNSRGMDVMKSVYNHLEK